MACEILKLPDDPAEALAALRRASHDAVVVLFKASPICPTSHEAEAEFRAWQEALEPGASVRVAVVDVIARRELARGVTTLLEVEHQSPQALLFDRGVLRWHDSHRALTQEGFATARSCATTGDDS